MCTARAAPSVTVAFEAQCLERYQGQVMGISAGSVLDNLHYVSGGAVGFARGLNDTPKIAAILLAGAVVSSSVAIAMVAVVMAVGGLVNARKVAETMALTKLLT